MKRDDVIARIRAEAEQQREANTKPPVLSIIPQGKQNTPVSRRIEALSLRMAGLSVEQIAERQQVTIHEVISLLKSTEGHDSSETLEDMRKVENARLDRAQAAIWPRVLEGDEKAIATFLNISTRRAKLNGLDAATKIDMSVSVRNEMERALAQLETVVLGHPIIEGEVVDPSDDDFG